MIHTREQDQRNNKYLNITQVNINCHHFVQAVTYMYNTYIHIIHNHGLTHNIIVGLL